MLHAKLYHGWGYNVVFADWRSRPAPTVEWTPLYQRRQTIREVVDLYMESKGRLGREPPILAVLTGPYQEEYDEINVVIDVDMEGVPRDRKMELENHFAKEGFVVVSTPRGFHLHFRVPRSERVYMITLTDVSEGGVKHAGDGAGLQPHMWTSPPSKRPLTGTFFTYSFVLPDGRRYSGFSVSTFKGYEPPTLSFGEVAREIESLLGYRVTRFTVEEWEEKKRAPAVAEAGEYVYRPIFTSIDEFHRRIINYPLPLPVARVLFNYYRGVGAVSYANLVARRNPALKYFRGPVPHGERFLVAASFTLFVAHTVFMPRFRDITGMLQYAIEDWPEDEGMPMDRELRHLLLFDDKEKEYVLPRYGGLGPLRPPLYYCERCFWRGTCGKYGAKPWRWVRKLVRGIDVGKRTQRNLIRVGGNL